jgi:hypothetical protein
MPEGHAPFAVFNRSANPLVRMVLKASYVSAPEKVPGKVT